MTDIPVDSLETLRNRLNQVHISLRKLNDQIAHHNRHPTKVKLPNYGHLQNQFQVILTQLSSLTSSLDNADILNTTNVYPLATFPAAQQEGLLTTLLRKKPLPEITEWIDDAITEGSQVEISVNKADEFAKWCSAQVEELQNEFQFWGFSSKELKNNNEIEDNDDGQCNSIKEKEMQKLEMDKKITDGNKEPMKINEVLKFMCQGSLPSTLNAI